MNNILCSVCARGGSKGVKNKNIKPINGLPLIAHSIKQAKETGLFEHIVISTDSDEIAEIVLKYGGEVFFKRSAELASDTAGKIDVIRDVFVRSEDYYKKQFNYLVDLDATSPLRCKEDIIESFNQFIKNTNDNLISAMPSRRSPYFNMVEIDEKGKVFLSKKIMTGIVRRQDAPKTFDMNASIYIWTRNSILNSNTLFSDNTGLYIMPEERSIDIDSKLDFEIVEYLMKKRGKCVN